MQKYSTLLIFGDDSWLHETLLVMNCKIGCLAFLYLGLSIDGNSCELDFLFQLIDCIKSRLLGWKSFFFFFWQKVGKVVIFHRGSYDSFEICYVMSFIPVYVLSFFKTPIDTISSMESILKVFLGKFHS